MVLCSVGLLFSLLYSSVIVSTQGLTSLVDNSADFDPEVEWNHLEHLLADEAKARHVLAGEAKARPLRPVFGSKKRRPSPRSSQAQQNLQAQQSQQQQSLQPEPHATMELPDFVPVPAEKDLKHYFSPEDWAPMLPPPVKEMLRDVTAPPPPAPTRPQQFEVLCHIDRMYVRVRKELFCTFNAYENLKMGSCAVNQASKDHYYLLYLLQSDCGFYKESNEDAFLYSVNVHYEPNTTNGIVRELSFAVPIQCRYHRFHHSFRAGYRSKLPEPVYTLLNSKPPTSISLTVKDESGNDVNIFTMGTPMCFEAELSSPEPEDRVYINECFVTNTPDTDSPNRYTVIANQGCMTDGMLTELSEFKLLEDTPRSRQRFCIAAFRFKDTLSIPSKLMYLHCDVSVGKLEADESSRACNFDLRYRRWRELYGQHSACGCCPDSCPPVQPRTSKTIVSSHAWKVADGSKMTQGKPESYADFLNHWENAAPSPVSQSSPAGKVADGGSKMTPQGKPETYADFVKCWENKYS